MSAFAKLKGFGNLAALASAGPAGMAPILAQALPNTMRVIAAQRVAMILAERAAALARAGSDVVASAIASGADVPLDHIEAMDQHGRLLAAAVADLGAALGQPGNTETVKRVYGYGGPPSPAVGG